MAKFAFWMESAIFCTIIDFVYAGAIITTHIWEKIFPKNALDSASECFCLENFIQHKFSTSLLFSIRIIQSEKNIKKIDMPK